MTSVLHGFEFLIRINLISIGVLAEMQLFDFLRCDGAWRCDGVCVVDSLRTADLWRKAMLEFTGLSRPCIRRFLDAPLPGRLQRRMGS